ncbi:hypothetical protein JEQ12_017143 [Ovis aries]|uniref:Uncharacterized protein n=1 Tax=Ovis aries TaxID=9940 RepID=A0A836A769_SHEEP|nr:hypothetical protein JEQ12_017143 [Ovis aries]
MFMLCSLHQTFTEPLLSDFCKPTSNKVPGGRSPREDAGAAPPAVERRSTHTGAEHFIPSSRSVLEGGDGQSGTLAGRTGGTPLHVPGVDDEENEGPERARNMVKRKTGLTPELADTNFPIHPIVLSFLPNFQPEDLPSPSSTEWKNPV